MGKYNVTAYNLAPLQALQYEQDSVTESPRAVAIINGTNYRLLSYEIEGNAHGATDSALIDLTLSDGPDWPTELYRDQNQSDPIQVAIYAGYPSNTAPGTSIGGLSQRFLGILDQYSLQIDGDVGTFRCRSLAAPLVDTQITTLAQNMTSVQFVQYYATQFGLKVVPALGNPPVTLQQVWNTEFVAGVKTFRIWDVILKCAVQDGVDAWVAGDTLYYAAPDLVPRTLLDLMYGRDLLTCTIVHSPNFNKNIKVKVFSYQPRTRVSTSSAVYTGADGGVVVSGPVTKTVTSTPVFRTRTSTTTSVGPTGTTSTTSTTSGGNTSGGASEGTEGQQQYLRYYPNLSPSQCLQLAKTLWQQISMHEYQATVKFPMTQSKLAQYNGVTNLVRLHGTPYLLVDSSATQTDIGNTGASSVNTKANDYWPRRVTEEFSAESGWTVELEMVNHTLPNGAI